MGNQYLILLVTEVFISNIYRLPKTMTALNNLASCYTELKSIVQHASLAHTFCALIETITGIDDPEVDQLSIDCVGVAYKQPALSWLTEAMMNKPDLIYLNLIIGEAPGKVKSGYRLSYGIRVVEIDRINKLCGYLCLLCSSYVFHQ